MFFVRSAEQIPCPCCGGSLKVIGSRERKYINGLGEVNILVIRRLRCRECNKIHHELPDILVPYKRHGSENIEAVIVRSYELTVAADESTISRWRNWFLQQQDYFLGVLVSIAIRYQEESVEGLSNFQGSALQRIRDLVGDAPGWLKRIVRPTVNLNLWVHTRIAFMSA